MAVRLVDVVETKSSEAVRKKTSLSVMALYCTPVNVEEPAAAVEVVPPANVPVPLGVSVITFAYVELTFANWSWAVTCGWVTNAKPLVATAGCVVNFRSNVSITSVMAAVEVPASALVEMLVVAVAPDVVAFVMPERM